MSAYAVEFQDNGLLLLPKLALQHLLLIGPASEACSTASWTL